MTVVYLWCMSLLFSCSYPITCPEGRKKPHNHPCHVYCNGEMLFLACPLISEVWNVKQCLTEWAQNLQVLTSVSWCFFCRIVRGIIPSSAWQVLWTPSFASLFSLSLTWHLQIALRCLQFRHSFCAPSWDPSSAPSAKPGFHSECSF